MDNKNSSINHQIINPIKRSALHRSGFFWYLLCATAVFCLAALGSNCGEITHCYGDSRDAWWHPRKIVASSLLALLLPLPHVFIALFYKNKRNVVAIGKIIKSWHKVVALILALFIAAGFLSEQLTKHILNPSINKVEQIGSENSGQESMDESNVAVIFKDAVTAIQNGDHATAAIKFRLVASQGVDTAQYNLGYMYSEGLGVVQDYAEAARWYRMAAEQGYSSAQFNLGGLYYRGEGVGQDYTQAARLYRLAAEQGHAAAQHQLGINYLEGHGVAQNFERAYMWVSLAASSGDEIAVKNRDRFMAVGLLDSQQAAEAESLAVLCKARQFKGC